MRYVDRRVPGGIAAQPPFTSGPAARRYCFPVANAMYFHASVGSGELFGIASAQLHSQPDDFVLSTGAKAQPFLPFTGLSLASRVPAATVATEHTARLPAWYRVRHSLKLAFAASVSPVS